MRPNLWIILAALASTGCRVVEPPTVTPVATDTPVAAAEPSTEADELAPRLRVAIHPRLEPSPVVEVSVELSGPGEPDPLAREWSLAGPLAQPFLVTITDAEGELDHRLEPTEDGGVKVVLERAPSLPVRFDYALAPVVARLGEVARIELDDAHLFATGEALLLLPDGLLDQRRELILELDPEVFTADDPNAPTGLPPIRAAVEWAQARAPPRSRPSPPSYAAAGWSSSLTKARAGTPRHA